MFADYVRWPDGTEASYAVWKQPDAALIVPFSATGTTFLVQQWRHSWKEDAWELPAGTWEEGEEPMETAQRELEEEAGLRALRWDSLGTARATAVSTMRFHFFLARDLSSVPRRPEIYEQDMVIREIPFEQALDEAASGTIQHAASIAALFRAARKLEESKK
jgi:ADP-ribose pyrophosphatase